VKPVRAQSARPGTTFRPNPTANLAGGGKVWFVVRKRMSIVSLVIAAIGGLAPMLATAPADAASYATWDRLANCESSGRWHLNTGNGFYGGLQFTPSTWRAYGGGKFAPSAEKASRVQQIKIAERVQHAAGWGSWPVCSRKIGLR
jgi:hypothetical protein